MRQIFFHIPWLNIPVYGYGVMMVVGFVAAMYLAQFLARRSKLDPEIFANAAILALITGVAGARLSHVLENLSQYTRADLTPWQNFVNAVNIREGGLTYYGGFLLAFPSLVLYAIWKKVPLPLGMDIIAICLMVGLGFGRIGCFLNGCCYGAECNVPWAVQFPYGSDAYTTEFDQGLLKMPVPRELIRDHAVLGEFMDVKHRQSIDISQLSHDQFRELDVPGSLKSKDQVAREGQDKVRYDRGENIKTIADLAAQQRANPVHPAEIYSSVIAFLIAAFLFTYFTLPRVPGRVFAAMMMIEGVFRYVLEMVRVEPPVIGRGTHYLPSIPGQSYSMVVSFILVAGGVGLWALFGWIANAPRRSTLRTGGRIVA